MASLDLRLGPLHYRFLPRDDFGQPLLDGLGAGLDTGPPCGRPGRLVNVARGDLGRSDLELLAAGRLPTKLGGFLRGEVPREGWAVSGDHLGFVEARLPGSPESFWLLPAGGAAAVPLFWIPWGMILWDIAAEGGAVAHGALALRETSGALFCAAAGGGKTTAMARLEPPWEVLSDDAALIWPSGTRSWLASPLPTWGAMHGTPVPEGLPCRWESGRAARLRDLFFVGKAGEDSCQPLDRVETARRLIVSLREHPAVVARGDELKVPLFRAACGAARNLRGWRLDWSGRDCPGKVITPAGEARFR